MWQSSKSAPIVPVMSDTGDIQTVLEELETSRAGPRPLSVHIGAALADCMKQQALPPVVLENLTGMIAGLRAYQRHPYKRAIEALDEIWRAGEVSLRHCPAQGGVKGTLLLIPSMINRSDILDLIPERSLTRWLAEQGLNVYLLDWGNPVDDAAMSDMDGVITERLVPAMRHLADRHSGDIHALGYCMGGTLLAGAAMWVRDILKSAVFLASPWDFHAGDKTLSQHVQMGTASALQMIESGGSLPVDWIQSVFAMVNADRTVHKFAGFADTDPDSDKAQLFVAVEDWLNDGVDLPGDVARTCILDWYGQNLPGTGEWIVDGRQIDLSALSCPALVVASMRDRLVPAESSQVMTDLLPRADLLKPDSGHIGMVTGRNAVSDVWNPLRDWLFRQ